MSEQVRRWVAVVTIAAFAHMGCYNSYFISKDELEKLESGVEVKEVVTVDADCKSGGGVAQGASSEGPTLAAKSSKSSGESGGEKATDAKKPPSKSAKSAGCKKVPVSTANAINVVVEDGSKRRVTPFNFMMSEKQLVSPEYDLLLSLKRVKGAKVREFSLWKTIGTIAGVSAVSLGTFIGISLTSSDEAQF